MNRLALLMRNDFVLHTKIIVISIIVILALLLINIPNSPFISSILFVGGLWITALSFNELHNPQKSCYFLTLPASHLEKLFNRWLFTAVLYPAFVLGIYLLLYMLKSGLELSIPLYHIANWIKIYLIFQSIFFLGAIYFKSHQIIKTLASILIFNLILTIYLMSLSWIFHTDYYILYLKFGFLWFLIPIYFWIVSYILFTESENY